MYTYITVRCFNSVHAWVHQDVQDLKLRDRESSSIKSIQREINTRKEKQETVDRRSSDMMKIEISEMENDYAILLLRYYFGHSGDVPAMKDQVLYQIRTGISMWMTWTH